MWACIVAGIVTLAATTARADPVVEPDDGIEVTRYANDWFGTSLAADGETLLVGAEGSSEYAFHTGEVHVYQSSSGSLHKVDSLGPVDPASLYFGTEVALSGDHAMVLSQSGWDSVIDFFHRSAEGWEPVAQSRSDYVRKFAVGDDHAALATPGVLVLLDWTGQQWQERLSLPSYVHELAFAGESLLVADGRELSVYEYDTGSWHVVGEIEGARPHYGLAAAGDTAVLGGILLERGSDGVWTPYGDLVAQAGFVDGEDPSWISDTAVEESRVTVLYDGRFAVFEHQANGEWEMIGETVYVNDDHFNPRVAQIGQQVLVSDPRADAVGYGSGVVDVYEGSDAWVRTQRLLPDDSVDDVGGCNIGSSGDFDDNWFVVLALFLGLWRPKPHRRSKRHQTLAISGAGLVLWLAGSQPAQACSYPSSVNLLHAELTQPFLAGQTLPTDGVIMVPGEFWYWASEPDFEYDLEVWDGETHVPGTQSLRFVDRMPPVTDYRDIVRYMLIWQPEGALLPNHTYELRILDTSEFPATESGYVYEHIFTTGNGAHTGLDGELHVEVTPGVDLAEVTQRACCELSSSSCGPGAFCTPTSERYGPVLNISATIPGQNNPGMVRFWTARLGPDGTQLPSQSLLSEESNLDLPYPAGYPTLPLGELQQQVMFPATQSEYCVVVGATSMIDGQTTTTTVCSPHSAETEPYTSTLDVASILAEFEAFEANEGLRCRSPVLYESNGEPVEASSSGCRVVHTPSGAVLLCLVVLVCGRRRRSEGP